jgi:uncharacterized repeat protein (TIGR04076 family)
MYSTIKKIPKKTEGQRKEHDMPYDVSVKVVSGHCTTQKEGDEWVVGHDTPAGICLGAFNSMLPAIRVLRSGGSFGSIKATKHDIACPDAANPVVYELNRIG